MAVWISVGAVTAAMTLVGVVGTLVTKRTRAAFLAGFNTMALVTGVFVWHAGPGPRAAIVVAMVVGYLTRINWTLLVWSNDTAVGKLDSNTVLREKLFLPIVLVNAVGWAYCLPFYFATRSTTPLGVPDWIAIAVYIVGTTFHHGGDYQKRRFKLRPDTKGKLLDTGFWRLCRHPNYFGDFLIYVSFAVLGGSVWGWVAPLFNLAQYAFDAIPKNEKWAAERYGAQWDAYRTRTKAFVPYLA